MLQIVDAYQMYVLAANYLLLDSDVVEGCIFANRQVYVLALLKLDTIGRKMTVFGEETWGETSGGYIYEFHTTHKLTNIFCSLL